MADGCARHGGADATCGCLKTFNLGSIRHPTLGARAVTVRTRGTRTRPPSSNRVQ